MEEVIFLFGSCSEQGLDGSQATTGEYPNQYFYCFCHRSLESNPPLHGMPNHTSSTVCYRSMGLIAEVCIVKMDVQKISRRLVLCSVREMPSVKARGSKQRYKIRRTPKSHLVVILLNFQKFRKIR
jgi:hypothetical protein